MTTHAWFAAFVAVNILDAALTLWRLRGRHGGNPLIRALMRRVHPAWCWRPSGRVHVAVGRRWPGDIAPAAVDDGLFAFCAWNVVQIGCRNDDAGNTRWKAIRKEQQHDAPSSAP